MKYLQLTLLALLFCFTANAQLPAPIVGPSAVCDGTTITLTDATPGGTWTSSTPTIATVNFTTGIVTGVSTGVTTITYTISTGSVTHLVTVNPPPTAITGTPTACLGGSMSLSCTPGGGTWTITPTTVATISPTTGVVIGISAGIATVTYTLGTGCFRNTNVTINAMPATITGPTSVCAGSAISLSSTTPGYTWSSSMPSVAVIDAFGGVTGIAPGTAVISYGSPVTGCSVTTTVTVTGAVGTISGPSTVCTFTPTTYSCAIPGGSWSTSNPAVGTIDGVTGVFNGIVGGTLNITYSVSSGCYATRSLTVMATSAAYAVSGGGSYCAGGSGVAITLAGSSTGVLYQLLNGSTPVGSPIAGTGAPLSFGMHSSAGTYTIVANYGSACAMTMTGSAVVTIDPLPTVYTVTGGGSYCAGGSGVTIGLSGSDLGIFYDLYLGSTWIAGPIAGTGAPISFGMMTVAGFYAVIATSSSTGCLGSMTGSATVTITPTTTPSVTMTASPGTTVCPGTSVTFTAIPTSCGTAPLYNWYLNGIHAGSTSSTYSAASLANGDLVSIVVTSSDPCPTTPTATTSVTLTISSPTVTATATTACGGVATLTGGGAVSYSWAPSTGLSCSTCGTTTILPTATTIYTVTGTDAFGCTNTANVTVNGNRISGHITYTGVSTDVFTVWLIQFNPSDSSIIATDSTSSCMDAGIPYYEFMSAPAGSYLAKAKLIGTTPGTSGYIPTYSLSTPNWYSAAGVAHTSAADVMNITMVYGTVPAGPGFISGYVYSGAGKGTAGEVPETGMLIYLKDLAGTVITYTYSDATGAYSFGSLAYGSYVIYPEDYKYYATPSAVITLAPGSETVSDVTFKKRTSYGTIVPFAPTKVFSLTTAAENHGVFPNPTSGTLNISMGNAAAEEANVIVTDMTGREVYNHGITINAVPVETQVDLNNIRSGIYLITIRSATMYYSGKLLIQK